MIEYLLAVSMMWVSPTGAMRSQEFTGSYTSHTACIKAMTDEVAAMEIANGVAPIPIGTELCVRHEVKRGSEKARKAEPGSTLHISKEEWASKIDFMQSILADLMLCNQQQGKLYGDEAERLAVATYQWNKNLGVSFDEDLHWRKIELLVKINTGSKSTIKSCDRSIANSTALQRSFRKLATRK